ncbi:MAG: CoB--CoM heterodisulfide reductase iron-sulfur subunit A family protein [Candidatus Methanoperedens sp.]|nr:CoB--CoM heterodisulfide reductase iron-sulfur subunit A family protein [Candidatus Methanoperedens sp.]
MDNNTKTIGAAVVVGGGIAGMQASLDLASSGIKVYLVETKPSIGGVMAQLDKTFPTNDCAMCTMAPRLVEISSHKNIELISLAEVESVKGEAGNFTVTVKKRPRYVDEKKCTGCGSCLAVCPVGKAKAAQDGKERKIKPIPDEYNEGLSTRPAVSIPFPQAIPNKAFIDNRYCLYINGGKCGNCKKACKADAIEFDQKEQIFELNVGAIMVTPGYELFDIGSKPEYGSGKFENVLTALRFERILSASGPYQGKVLRPSDKKIPKKLAFIQCVGSRDHERDYCSAVCCMYATKEALIAKEHLGDQLEIDILYMDIRAYGKGFEEYYQRAQKLGVNYIRCRVPDIEEKPDTKNLVIHYLSENDKKVTREYDMIILSTGLLAPKSAKQISSTLGITLNEYNFCNTGPFTPVNSSREGIFVAGPFTEPKDVPETVIQASGAASKALSLLCGSRGTLIKEKEYPSEKDITGQEARIGVFICHCGKNIGGVANVPEVVKYASTLPSVVHAEDNLYMCSSDAIDKIKQKIEEHHLNRVVVASCTPRTHEPLFKNTIREAGLNEYLFEMANIREHCTWAHMHEPEAATKKAKGLVQMAVAKSKLLEPLYRQFVPINQDCLVIGGGIAGMTAAKEVADKGFLVHLVEKEAQLGGNARKLHYLIDGANPQDYLNDLIKTVNNHENIRVHTASPIESLNGSIGKFKTVINNAGNKQEIEHGAVILATGGIEHKPSEYMYGKNKRVMTQLELEDKLVNDPKFKAPECVVMIQCVESRNDDRPYCSRICCASAVKNALKIKEKYPDAGVYVLYRDMRTFGFLEGYYTKARQKGIVFSIYDKDRKPELIESKNGNLTVRYFDSTMQENIEIDSDYVVLSTPVIPRPENKELASLLKVPLDQNKFFLEAHIKLRPVDFATDGIFLCGLAHYPKSIKDSIAQAGAAAARASTILSKKFIETEGAISVVDEAKCIGCGTCVNVCPYNAPALEEVTVTVEEVTYKTKKSRINPAACKGCGSCAAACPAGAITAQHFSSREIREVIDAFDKGVRGVSIEKSIVEVMV